MTEGRIKSLTEEQGIARIVETLKRAPAGDAPFVLVLGAGFNQGLVPTTRELIAEALPLWIKSLEEGETYDYLKGRLKADESAAIARAFWVKFVKDNELDLKLGPRGIPQDAAAAYKAAFNPEYAGALGAPADARAFQRALIRPNQLRLNAAHFLLASILGAQPGRNRASDQLTSRAALTRLILTTNFDPFLQTALQLVNRHYFISDTPDLSLGDEIFDDASDAIRLVYVHGSIHRRSHKATAEDVQRIKDQNARMLAPLLKQHGIIVLGYSGWDDAIVDALAACPSFNHRLYWCGMRPDPSAKGAFGEKALEVLRKPSAFYVNIRSAEQFMARLSGLLVRGLPRLLDNPIAQTREMLEGIDLSALGNLTIDAGARSAYRLSAPPVNKQLLLDAKDATVARLQAAESLLKAQSSSVDTTAAAARAAELGMGEHGSAKTVPPAIERLLAQIGIASALGYYNEILRCCEAAFALAELEPAHRRRVLSERALARFHLADFEGALEDWGTIAQDPEASIDQVATALIDRGVVWSETGEQTKAIADYTRVIEELQGVAIEHIANALSNRGASWGEVGDRDKAIADYTRVIDSLPGASAEQIADALNRRAAVQAEGAEWDKAIADYTRVIDALPGAPVDCIAQALYNRGATWARKGDTDEAIADYTRVIEALPDAPVDEVAKALNARSALWEQREQASATDDPIADPNTEPTSAPAAEAPPSPSPSPSIEPISNARESRDTGIDYARVIDAIADASPVDRVAKVLYNRTGTWGRKAEPESIIASDYARLFESPDNPVEPGAMAFDSRSSAALAPRSDVGKASTSAAPVVTVLPGLPIEQALGELANEVSAEPASEQDKVAAHAPTTASPSEAPADLPTEPVAPPARRSDVDEAIADYTRLIDGLPNASVKQIAKALYNRGVTWGRKGEIDKAIADYTRVIEELPGAPVDQIAKALINRGVAWSQKGDPDNAIADYTYVIDALPDAPADQVANAYANRGWLQYERGDFANFLADTTASLEADPASVVAAFNLGLALLSNGRDTEAMDEYRRAAGKHRSRIQAMGIADLEAASTKWLSAERAAPVMEMLRSLMV